MKPGQVAFISHLYVTAFFLSLPPERYFQGVAQILCRAVLRAHSLRENGGSCHHAARPRQSPEPCGASRHHGHTQFVSP